MDGASKTERRPAQKERLGFTEVKPVSNALAILSLLTQAKDGANLTEIAGRLDINPSTCLGILRTLVLNGMAEFNPRTKIYAMGDGLVSLSSSVLAAAGIEDRFRHAMERIADEFGVTVSLWRVEGADRMRLALSVVSGRNVNIQMRVGQRLPRWIAAAGRVMAAYSGLTPRELAFRYRELQWRGPMTFERYLDQVNDAHARGFAIDNGEFAPGVYSLAVPVWSGQPELGMALSATMFIGQMDEGQLKVLSDEMIRLGGKAPQSGN